MAPAFDEQTASFQAFPVPVTVLTITADTVSAGYETAYIGKWHLSSTGDDSFDIDLGEHFNNRKTAVPIELRGGYKDYWLAADTLEFTSDSRGGFMFDIDGNKIDFKGYRATCETDFVIDYLNNRKTDKPFFLFVSYLEPHHQNAAHHFEGPDGSKEKYKKYAPPRDLTPFDGDWKDEYPDYLGCCSSLDENVRRILRCLTLRGELDNTLVIYTSDHGCHFRTRNSEYKRSCHDASVHIPLIINGPGFKGGKVIDDMVSLLDLPATLLNEAQIEVPPQMSSRPLQPLALGIASDWEQEVFIQISESQVGRAIRTKKWKYSACAPDKDGFKNAFSSLYQDEFLYDLKEDPHELINLVSTPGYEEIIKELRQRLIMQMLRAGEAAPEIVSAESEC